MRSTVLMLDRVRPLLVPVMGGGEDGRLGIWSRFSGAAVGISTVSCEEVWRGLVVTPLRSGEAESGDGSMTTSWEMSENESSGLCSGLKA